MPVETTYVCDGCRNVIDENADAFWLTLDSWHGQVSQKRHEHLILHSDRCAARYFDLGARGLRNSAEAQYPVGPQ